MCLGVVCVCNLQKNEPIKIWPDSIGVTGNFNGILPMKGLP